MTNIIKCISRAKPMIQLFVLVLVIQISALDPVNAAGCGADTGNPNAPAACGAAQGTNSPATQGNTSGTQQGAGNPINVITGNKYQEEADMPALPGELGLEIVRHYNSSYHALGMMGYGWRLSYETDLYVVNNTLQIAEADGSRIIFVHDPKDTCKCAALNPAYGKVTVQKTPHGDEYLWIWLNGRQLHFNTLGKLERISTPTGQIVTLQRGLRGELLKVTDPQGRSMTMEYAANTSLGFKGIIAINSPVGRFSYTHDDNPSSAGISNLLSVTYPKAEANSPSIRREYHYGETSYTTASSNHKEPNDPSSSKPNIYRAHLLTGITVHWQAPDGKPQYTRTNTWAYDAQGRGILSVKGLPKQLDAKGNIISGTGLEQVNLSYQDQDTTQPKPHHQTARSEKNLSGQKPVGTTMLTNSLGQTTTYTHTQIASEYRLLSVIGAGCVSCGEPNVKYSYDNAARLTQTTHLNTTGNPTYAELISYDALGRITQQSRIAYIQGKAQSPKIVQRYAYAQTQQDRINNLPSLIAAPSVIAGKEHQITLQYNAAGQPIEITETGYSPLTADTASAQATQAIDPTQQPTFISRSTHYRYSNIRGKSLLTQIDGPLPNGKTNSPLDSDITQFQYDQEGRYLTQIIAPNNIVTKLEYDLQGQSASTGGTGRVVETIASNGIATRYSYANVGHNAGEILSTQRQPISLSLAAAKQAGLVQTTSKAYDVFGNLTMIRRADGQVVYLQYSPNGKLAQLRDGPGNRVEWKDWDKGNQDATQTITAQQWFTADAPDTVARAWYFWHDSQQRLTQRLSPDGGLDTWRYSDPASPSQRGSSDSGLSAQNQTQWLQHIDPLNRMTLDAVNNQDVAKIRMTLDGYVDASFKLNSSTSQLDREQTSTQNAIQPTQVADDFGRIVQFSSPQHGTHAAQYNLANDITHITQADGTQIDYSYDVGGRLLRKIVSKAAKQTGNQASAIEAQSDTKDTVYYSYNAFGLQQIKDAHQTITYTQDALGRESDKVTTLELQNKTGQPTPKTYHIRTRYDALGRICAKQLIDGQWLVFTFDKKTGLTNALHLHQTIWPALTNKLAVWLNMPDLPLQIATKETVVTDVTIHPFNGITNLTHGNGIHDNYSFDLAGRLTNVSFGANNRAQQPQNDQMNRPLIQASYTYDTARRLTSEKMDTDHIAGKVKEYNYTGWNHFATPPKSGFVQADIRNTASNRTAFNDSIAKPEHAEIDQAGRTTSDAHYRYQYNAWGKLSAVQASTNNRTIATYQSNALGERIMASYPALANSTENTSQTHYYLYDHQQRIAELDAQGNITQQYLYINQIPVAVINAPSVGQAKVIAVHTDRRNAPIAATDEHGKVIWQAQYDAWGALIQIGYLKQNGAIQSSNFSLGLRLPGQWQDQATGLYYNYQRDYNPETGRYLTPDPLGFPDSADPYAYVNNDPLNKQDPLGLYQIDMHYYMTLFLGITAGLDPQVAKTIALASQYIDDNPETRPIDLNVKGEVDVYKSITTNQDRLKYYHFMQDTLDKSKGAGIHDVMKGNQLNNLYNAI